MSLMRITSETLTSIANEIRAKTGKSATMTPAQMVTEIGSISGKKTLSWHQCPEAVRNYLAYVAAHPYSTSDYNATAILDYAPTKADQANTKPVGYVIDGVTFRDNEPLVATPFVTANKAGTLTALDKLRWFNTTCANASGGNTYPVGYNCRDLGGWACDGGTVKYGLLVRSGEINPVDKDLMVNKIGIKTEVNILPLDQQKSTGSVWGIDYTANPSNDDIQYRLNYTDQWKLYLQTIFASVAHSKPVLFHCGAGADKTGTLAVVLLGLLGCSLSDIDTDYELTTFASFSTWRNRTYTEYQNLLNAIKAVPLANGLTDSFQNRCASFALSLDITADEINAFRSACIDGMPTPIEPTLYTNLADPSSEDWAADSRLGSNGTPRSGATGAACTNYISVTQNDVIRVKGFGDLKSYNTAVYNASKTVLSVALANNQTAYFSYNYDSTTGIVTMTITNANVKWIRFSSTLTGAANDVIITKNEPI